MKIGWMLAILALPSLAQAEGIICSKDARPVDGPLTQVSLVKQKKTGRYDLKLRVAIMSRAGSSDKTTTLATNLTCNLDGKIAFCFKSSRVDNEKSNSIVRFEKVVVTSINSLQQIQAVARQPMMRITVGSPLIKRLRREFTFLYDLDKKIGRGGCKTL